MRPRNLYGFWRDRAPSPVRQLAEMTAKEIEALQAEYGARVVRIQAWRKERPQHIRRAIYRRQPAAPGAEMEIQKTKPAATPMNGATTMTQKPATCSNGCEALVWARGLCACCYSQTRQRAIKAGTWKPDATKSKAMHKMYARKARKAAREAAKAARSLEVSGPVDPIVIFDTSEPPRLPVPGAFRRVFAVVPPRYWVLAASLAAAVGVVIALSHK